MKKVEFHTPFAQNLFKIVVLMVMVIVIAICYPRITTGYRQKVEVGKPWAYGLITAPYDFPIYKSDAQVSEEKALVKRSFTPYFNINTNTTQYIDSILVPARDILTLREQIYLSSTLKQIYRQGIMSAQDMSDIQNEGYKQLAIVNDKHVATAYPIDYCFTPKTAYNNLLSGSPEGDMSMLNRLSLNKLLVPNLTLDTLLTKTRLNQKFAELAIYSGMVQKGEKIIDRGEIVTEETAQIIASLKLTEEERGINKDKAAWQVAGLVTIIVVFVLMMSLYLLVFRPDIFNDNHAILFFSILITSIVVTACLAVRYTALSIYIVPFAWVPIITRVFYDSRTALYMHLVTIFICAMLAPVPYEFLIVQIIAGMVAVSSLKDMAERSQLAKTAFWIFISYCVSYTAVILAEKGSPDMLHWQIYVYFLANALLVVFSYGLIYVFEKMFSLVSSITLVELTNVNSDFMLSFAEKAPGTFQHCLQVSNLAMEAAKRVRANALLVRTGALYHDIGKLNAPHFFTENQRPGENPLLKMSPIDAAQTIIRHVSDGVELAKKNDLPEVVIDFIRSHHGTSKTRYFYNTWLNNLSEEDRQNPDIMENEHFFCYQGPTPSTKETAILMMADAVEARSRSLTDMTEDSIRAMVNSMIEAQMAEHQFDNAPLTFKDIQAIKQVFTDKLISMNHHRIKYPEVKEK